MLDTKLIQGLLIAACVFLAVGIITTALGIQGYKAAPSEQTAAQPPTRPEPDENDAEAEADTEVQTDTPVDEDGGEE